MWDNSGLDWQTDRRPPSPGLGILRPGYTPHGNRVVGYSRAAPVEVGGESRVLEPAAVRARRRAGGAPRSTAGGCSGESAAAARRRARAAHRRAVRDVGAGRRCWRRRCWSARRRARPACADHLFITDPNHRGRRPSPPLSCATAKSPTRRRTQGARTGRVRPDQTRAVAYHRTAPRGGGPPAAASSQFFTNIVSKSDSKTFAAGPFSMAMVTRW